MENSIWDKQQKIMEVSVSFVISLHLIFLFVSSIYQKFPSWVAGYMLTCCFILWAIVLGKFKDLKVRVILVTLMMQSVFVIYIMYTQELTFCMIPFVSISVLLSIYGYASTSILSIIGLIVMHGCYLLFIWDRNFADSAKVSEMIIVLFNVLVTCLIQYFINRVRARNHEKLEENFVVMQKAQKGKDDFLANVSHEIRTPVNTISGLSNILLNEEDPTRLKDELNNICVAGRNLMFVVSDILDFSELENGDFVLAEETYNISSTINDLVNMSVAQSGNKPIDLLVNYEADLPRGLIGDEKRIRRALMNVVGNAYKFSERGCVVIDISHREEEYGINLIFAVRDTGRGMKPEELEKLFSTYNQADAGRTRAAGGIGLGLAITRAIVQKMGGTISVYSGFEKGTEIRIVIPQKVVDSRPIVTVKNPDAVNVCIYFDMEKLIPETREEYHRSVSMMVRQFKIKTSVCKNLAELKRRQSDNAFTHMFISLNEYLEDSAFFDTLAQKLKLVVILDNEQSDKIQNPYIYQIFKPFQLMPIAQAINNELSVKAMDNVIKRAERFVAPNTKVLVVDDNEMNIKVIGGLIKKYQISYDQALSGAEALEMIESQKYDFVFMDHMMPEMDGVECLHRLRQKSGDYFKKVPVVALTANAVAGAREMLLAEGFDDFVEKPVEISVLERMLLRILSQNNIVYLDESQSTQISGGKDENNHQSEGHVTVFEVSGDDVSMDGNYTYSSLNKENGYLYCGGPEAFEEIIEVYANKGDQNYLPLKEVYEKEDWTNYTIMIHAVKSSMKAIGADILSEKARLLEMAGKENNIAYIRDNHDEVYEMYQALILDFMKRAGKEMPSEQSSEVDLSSLEELSAEQMSEMKKDLESAMFDLDGDKMIEVLSRAKGKQYNQKALDKIVSQVEEKIKMSDFMSAYDAFSKL